MPWFRYFLVAIFIGLMIFGRKQYKDKKAEWGEWLTIACVLLILAVACSIVLFPSCHRSPQGPSKTQQNYEARIGEIEAAGIGKQVASMLQSAGAKALVIADMTYDFNPRKAEALKAALAAAGKGRFVIEAIEVIPWNEDTADFMMMGEGVSPQQVNEKINKHPNVDIIFFFGTMPMTDMELNQLVIWDTKLYDGKKRKKPMIAAASTYPKHLLQKLGNDSIHVISWQRRDVMMGGPTGADSEEIPEGVDLTPYFEKYFHILTKEKIKEMRGAQK